MSARLLGALTRRMESSVPPAPGTERLSLPEALAERRPRLYLALALAAAVSGHLLLLAFPVGAVSLGLLVLGGLLDPQGLAQHWSLVVAQATAAGLLVWASYGIARLRPPLPAGIDPSPSSRLYPLIEQLRSQLRSAPIHHVRLTSAPEVRLVRTPGCLLLPRLANTLQVGLPLLLTVSPENLRVLVAQRVGELAYGLRHVPGWIALLAGTWRQIEVALAQGKRPACRLARRGAARYARMLAHIGGPALRQADLLAERTALEILDDEQVKAAVTHQALVRHSLEKVFWGEFWSLAKRHETPPHGPMSVVASAVARCTEPERALATISRLMDEPRRDAQPTLRERLDSLGHRVADLPKVPDPTAANVYLDRESTALAAALDQEWTREHLDAWQARYRRGKTRIRDGLALFKKAKAGTLSQEESWDFAQLIQRRIKDRRKARKLFKQLLASDPRHARTQFLAGRSLMDVGDEAGARALMRSAELDPGLRSQVLRLIARFNNDGPQRQEAF